MPLESILPAETLELHYLVQRRQRVLSGIGWLFVGWAGMVLVGL